MNQASDAIRRWLGLAFLLIALVLLVLGLTVLDKPLGRGLVYLGYWLMCIGLTGLALLSALVDMLIVGGRARRAQRELAHRTLGGEKSADAEDVEQ